LTVEDAIKPIAAGRAFVDERRPIDILLKPDVTIARQYGSQLRVAPVASHPPKSWSLLSAADDNRASGAERALWTPIRPTGSTLSPA